MLTSEHRLRQDKDLSRVFRRGRRFGSGAIGLTVVQSNIRYPRFAVVVGSKVAKRATDRNKIKRRLREIIRKLLKNGKICSNIDVVVNARSGAKDQGFAELKKDLIVCLERARIIKNFG